ncbi:MAG: hypothetical protein AAGE01_15405 [Pseudomonadota bacterium]
MMPFENLTKPRVAFPILSTEAALEFAEAINRADEPGLLTKHCPRTDALWTCQLAEIEGELAVVGWSVLGPIPAGAAADLVMERAQTLGSQVSEFNRGGSH